MEASTAPTETSAFEDLCEALERIAWHKKRLDFLESNYAEQRTAIQAKIAFHEQNLEGAGLLTHRLLAKSSIDTPAGRVTVRTKRGTFEIADKEAAEKYAEGLKGKGVECFRVRRELVKSKLREVLIETEEGALCDGATGEAITFAKIEGKGEKSVSYKLKGEE